MQNIKKTVHLVKIINYLCSFLRIIFSHKHAILRKRLVVVQNSYCHLCVCTITGIFMICFFTTTYIVIYQNVDKFNWHVSDLVSTVNNTLQVVENLSLPKTSLCIQYRKYFFKKILKCSLKKIDKIYIFPCYTQQLADHELVALFIL